MGKGSRAPPEEQNATLQHHSAAPAAAPEELLAHPQYQPFQAPDFNAAEFTSRALAASRTTAHAQSEELRQGLRQLEAALSSAVVSRHGDLLAHARRLLDADAGAQEVTLSVGSLQAAVRRIRAEVEGPYAAVHLKTRQLRALHATIELLRALLLRLKLTAKLRQQLDVPAGQVDQAKAAKLLADVAAASGGDQLAGVALAAADEEFLRRAAATVREQAQVALDEGMEAMSQAKVGSALQVFFNLGELTSAVDGMISRHVHDLDKTVRSALDSRHLSLGLGGGAAGAAAGGPGGARGVSMPQPGAAGSWQEKLWDGVRAACDALVAGGVAIWHLQRVAAKKRDPLTHALFLDELCGGAAAAAAGAGAGAAAADGGGTGGPGLLTDRYWSEALRVLTDALAAASKPSKGGFVREALSAGYPKLVAALEAAFLRLQQDTRVRGIPPAAASEQLPALLAAAAPFRDAYLAAVLGRLQDSVAAFSAGGRSLPSPADVQKCIAAMHRELRGAGGSAQLSGQVAAVVGRSLVLLAQRAEYMAAAGPELRALALAPGAGGASAAQQRNIALASQLQEVHRSLVTLLPRLPPTAAAALDAPLASLQAAALDAVTPIFRSLVDALEAKMTGMHAAHAARWGRGEQEAPAGGMMDTSGYVTEVVACLSYFRSEYLMRFSPPPTPQTPSSVCELCQRSAGRLLAFFARHAALLRPLPPPAKLQLAKDMAELQAGVGQALWPLEALGPAVRCLRAFRALLFVEDAALDPAAPPVRDLPASVALHHMFSRLPPAVQAPHERSGLSPAQYSKWLDQHSAADAVRGAAAALDAAKATAAALSQGQEAVVAAMRQICASAAGGAPAGGAAA